MALLNHLGTPESDIPSNPLSTNLATSPAPTDSLPYLFFHGSQPWWDHRSRTSLPTPYNSTSLASQPALSSLGVNVSNPALLRTWLATNPASQITTLHVHIDPYITFKDTPSWIQLLSVLARDATNLQHLSVYWDAEGWMQGLGKDVAFLRALVTLRVKSTIVIEGFYAVRWPEFIERKMGLRPVQAYLRGSHTWVKMVREFQRGTEGIIP